MRWFERKFRFDLPEEMFEVVVERLRGTPARIEDKIQGVAGEVLRRRRGEEWSVLEQIGHLLDLDELHTGRLDDYLAGARVLRPADLDNKKTKSADHNRREPHDLVAQFRRERMALVERLERWPRPRVGQSAEHPRLQQPMRVIDMALFVAEHDDHHLSRMTELLRERPAQQEKAAG